MPKLKIFYILTLVILGVLLVFTVFKPIATGGEYTEIQREQLLNSDDGYIIQFDIFNHEGEKNNYEINISVDDQPSTLIVGIREEGAFTYIKHINRDMLTEGEVIILIYKDGQDSPFEEITYYLK